VTTLITPAWIDIQVNGFAGVDYCSAATPGDEIARSVRVIWSTGVARFFPTVITGAADDMANAIKNLAKAKSAYPLEGRAMAGFHIEGPHISPDDGPRGAHPKHCVRPPDIEELKHWIELSNRNIKLITIAPEWPGATAYIEFAVQQGIVISIGHTDATSQQITDAVIAGATLSTHLGNGAHAILPRNNNYIWDQLGEDRLAASFIVDGFHLSPAFLKTALRAKQLERCILITDAVMPAGCQPGPYKLGEVEVELHADGHVTLRGQQRLAGAALRMDRAIENVMRTAGLTIQEATAIASTNPARVCRLPDRPGDKVEFTFDEQAKSISVQRVWMDGEQVH
jgi:N-acetylglucosamine-6-phosphate deacetylase